MDSSPATSLARPPATTGASPVRGVARGLTRGLIAATAMATLLALLARQGWLFDLLTFWHQQLFALAALLAIGAALSGLRAWAVLAAAATLVNGAVVLVPATAPAAPAPMDDAVQLRVLSFNLLTENYFTGRVERFLRKTGADVLVLQEVTPYWGTKLEALRDLYPHVRPSLVPFSSDVVVMSRRPLLEAEVLPVPPDATAAAWVRPLRAVVELDGQRVVLYAVHPETPRSPERWRKRNAQLAWLADAVPRRDPDRPVLVAGDFNAPPWSPFLRDLLHSTGLRSAAGGGFRWPTRQPMLWSPYLSWLGAPVDHVLVSPGIAVDAFSVQRDVESDHLPIMADLRLPIPRREAQSSVVSPAR
jgi:endonuclease/exonuclease/phosphatase (EEP) superfamily protein YafD